MVTADKNIVTETQSIDLVSMLRYTYEKMTGNEWDALMSTLGFLWNVYSVIAIIFSLVCIVGFVYAKVRYSQLRALEDKALLEEEAKWAQNYENAERTKNTRWESIQQHIQENSPEAWRIAIIEADILLEETLRDAGYAGQTVSQMLKTANTQSFTTVQDAWDAHKVRNDIAHIGSDFVLTRKSAQEAVMRFERVFREFGVI